MNYNAATEQSPERHTEFIKWHMQNTVDELKLAQGDEQKLRAIVQQFINKAATANIDLEEIENILGVNEACIMDLAELSETDEEIVIDAFEQFTNI